MSAPVAVVLTVFGLAAFLVRIGAALTFAARRRHGGNPGDQHPIAPQDLPRPISDPVSIDRPVRVLEEVG
jgi:hypothetical protein